jgi:hypothetical protein
MPTGYTAGVADGTIKDFKTFALRCARNFGALVTMRDEPFDAEIPESFEPSSYYKEKLENSLNDFENFKKLTNEQIEEQCQKSYEDELASYNEYKEKDLIQQQNYENMLKKVKDWNPPTSEHQNMKKFMVEQLTESIRFDCGYSRQEPIKLSSKEWAEKEFNKINKDIEYYQKALAEEEARCRERTEWIKALRNSL